MENIYKLGERYARISGAYEAVENNLETIYEENGGEVTEETEALEQQRAELQALREEIQRDVLSAPDEYAAIVKNAEANKKIIEAELKALKEEQAKVCQKYEAKIKRLAGKIAWFKDNIADAMKLAEIEKIGGAKTPNKFSIWFSKSTTVEADAEMVLAPHQAKIQELVDSLPKWVVVKTDINKTELKANLMDDKAQHPDGAMLNETKNLQIR